MTPERWERIKELFSSVAEAAPEERQTILRSGCHGDEELRAEVERLLQYRLSTETFLDRPLSPVLPDVTDAPLLSAGEVVAARFQIIRPLGAGGMGEVYEATDVVRKQRVAVKVLRRDKAELWFSGERQLRREVELAQQISHRNVCRVNDLYLHEGDRRFLVVSMELLEGRNLSQLRADGRHLSLPEVEEIARQLCAGIDAAHAAGVVHRDLKPSNVMVVDDKPGMRVVITDFGIARSAAAIHSESTTHALAGTPLYMAPEQLEGRSDSRSDLYSLCLILYELITGELPFAGSRRRARAVNRLVDSPTDPGSLVPGLSPVWRMTLLTGLARDPNDRFRSGREILASLESCSRLRRFALAIALLSRSIWQRRAAKWAAAAVVVLAVALGVILSRSRPTRIDAFSRLVFAGLDEERSDDPVLAAAGDSLLAAIRQSPHLEVAGTRQLSSAFAHMGISADTRPSSDAIREAALRTGRRAVLFGSVTKDRGYRIHLDLELLGNDPRHPTATVSRDFEAGDSAAMFRAIETASRWVRQQSGEGRTEFREQDAPPEDLTTPSWKALQLLREARVRRARGDSSSALIFVQEALQADPGFAAAESLRGDILVELRQYRNAMDAHRNALRMVRLRNLSGRERYEIESQYNEDTGDYSAAQQTYKAWMAHFPNDYLPHFYVAGVLQQLGDDQQSLRQMEIARSLDESGFVIYPHLAAHYMAVRRWTDAAGCAQKLRELGEPNWGTEVEGRIAFARGRYDEALAAFKKLAALKDEFWQSLSPFYVARVLAEQGKLDEASQVLSAATAIDRQRGLASQEAERRVATAYVAWQKRDAAKVRDEAAQAVQALDNPDSLAMTGALLARVGDVPAAESVERSLERWPEVPRVDRARKRLRAELAIDKRSPQQAALVQAADTGERTPVALDFALFSALRLGRKARAEQVSAEILGHPDSLLNSVSGAWWGTPGLYRLAACSDAPASAQCGVYSAVQ